jgi:glycosyltransferase involved in cell wall biosynthesis
MARRILYVQYTNPAGYPPLMNSATLLAEAGWQVRVLGVDAHGTQGFAFAAHPAIDERRLRAARAGWRQKLHYVGFLAWAWAHALRWRPEWIYVSDPLASPLGLLASAIPGARVLYHEHDHPGAAASRFFRWIMAARRRLAHRAGLCVLPNAERVEAFKRETGRKDAVHCVWNCPRIAEAPPAKPPSAASPLMLYYHGSLNDQRVPPALLDALARLPDTVCLSIVGYETLGSAGFVAAFQRRAAELGVAGRVRMHGAVDRAQALRLATAADVGLVLVPRRGDDVNLEHLVGASNKAFDYLAAGLMLLVTDRPDWNEAFVAPGLARACDPADARSLAQAVRWCLDHRADVSAAGERGRRRVIEDWNYDRQFAPVLERLSA